MNKIVQLKRMMTEDRNSNTMNLDVLDTVDLVRTIQQEDVKIAEAVAKVVPQIANAVDRSVIAINQGGRMIYFGAGTSGRLGVLDATECSPTFGIESNIVQAFIAGGKDAMFQSIENAEDSFELGVQDAQVANISSKDIVVGIAASGRTPYVLGALTTAKKKGAFTIGVVNNPNSEIKDLAHITIEAVVGAEALTGSTRMKAGTAQKMILNLLSTATMVRLGKAYENLMVDLKPTNDKLRERALSIICAICDVERHIAEGALVASNNKAKTAILMIKRKLGRAQAEELLRRNNNFLRKALDAELSQ